MAKIERKYMAHYIDAAAPATEPGTPKYVRIGKDLEEYSPEMSADVQKTKNILGETSVLVASYEKSGSVEPYYAEKGVEVKEDEIFVGDGAKSDIVFFMRRFSDIMSAFFRGQIAVALIMALLLGTGFAVCGIKFGFILGFCAISVTVLYPPL